MGTVLGLIATYRKAGLAEFQQHFADAGIDAFRRKVTMALDPEVDREYPRRWIGKVTVRTVDGRQLSARVDEPKGDPGNTLSRAEIVDKAVRLAQFTGAATADETRAIARAIYALPSAPRVAMLLAGAHAVERGRHLPIEV